MIESKLGTAALDSSLGTQLLLDTKFSFKE